MIEALTAGEKPIRQITTGSIAAGPQRGWAQSAEVVGAMMHSASDLMSLSEELPVMDLEVDVWDKTRTVMGVYRAFAGPSASDQATGMVTGTYAQFWDTMRLGGTERRESIPLRSFGAAQTSGIAYQALVAQVLGLTTAESVDSPAKGSTSSTIARFYDSYLRRSHSQVLTETTEAVEEPEMETDYPNLVRALNSGLLRRLSRPPAPIPQPPEETVDVDVERQVSYGRTAEAPTELHRRPGVRSLFDD